MLTVSVLVNESVYSMFSDSSGVGIVCDISVPFNSQSTCSALNIDPIELVVLIEQFI